MRGVDLARYRFDFDLTFAMLTLHPDGHVYHRYGGRDERGPGVWLSSESFEALLEATLDDHERYESKPAPEPPDPAVRLEDVPAFAEKDQGKCIHCHSVLESLYRQRKAEGELRDEDLWVFPAPAIVGFDLDRDDQRRITQLTDGSPAAHAGLLIGDRILRIGSTAIASASDVMHALDRMPAIGGELEIEVRREGSNHSLRLDLHPGWRTGTPRSFAWRPLKWALDPVPGFGGAVLSDEERKAAGLDSEPFAFRIDYFVTSGPRQHVGRAAREAGLREGDIVYRVGDQTTFASIDHFHAWWRLTRKPGEQVEVRYVRERERGVITLTVGS